MWQTWFGRSIYQSEQIQVRQNYFYRWLTFNSDTLQTVIHRKHPAQAVLEYINPFISGVKINPGASCMLGLGGGGVAHALSRVVTKDYLDIVEISSEVITVAKTYFFIENISNLNIYNQDAAHFVQTHGTQYQNLLIDIYGPQFFPIQCKSENFFTLCRNTLLPGGLLALNIAVPEEYWGIYQLLRESFTGNSFLLPVKGSSNIIAFASATQSLGELLTLFSEKAGLRFYWDDKWGCMAL